MMELLNRQSGEIRLFSDVYDWNYLYPFENGKPQGNRDKLIQRERKRVGVDDTHGFNLLFYGVGHIKTAKHK